MNDISIKQRQQFNALVSHPLQSFEWGEFRKKLGTTVIRKIFEEDKTSHAFQLTVHPIPYTPFTIGYLPKGPLPTKLVLEQLNSIGKQYATILVQLEPQVEKNNSSLGKLRLLPVRPAVHPLFTQYTFILDLTKSEDELLARMHSKTRYNIRLATRKGVLIKQDHSNNAFQTYLRLTEETTNRQRFYAHTKHYHTIMWETLKIDPRIFAEEKNFDQLTAHLFTATYQKEILTTWILFVFKDTLYYPYGASSSFYREVMASNVMMWEAIRFGKKLGLKKFDMWGALGPQPNPSDPWFGFHRFKQGYGATLTEYVGSYDYVLNPSAYLLYSVADKLRWALLRLRR